MPLRMQQLQQQQQPQTGLGPRKTVQPSTMKVVYELIYYYYYYYYYYCHNSI